MDISKHVEVSEAVLSLIFAIGTTPEILISDVLKTEEILNATNNSLIRKKNIIDDNIHQNYVDIFALILNEESRSILDARNKLLHWSQNIQIYLDKLSKNAE